MTVLIGYLPTAEGDAAFQAALSEAKRRNEKLLCQLATRQSTPQRRHDNARTNHRTHHHCPSCRSRHRHPHDPHTDFPELILNIAIQASAAGIVIGLRRRSRLSKFLYSSNAQQILIEADQPVLAVNQPPMTWNSPSGRRCINRTRA